MAATFYPGSAIRAQDLNNNFEQLQLAIQEGRCKVPDWLFDFLDKYYWNKLDETTYTTSTWATEATDDFIPTTGATQQDLLQRWDKRTETTYIGANWVQESNDANVPTTGAVETELSQRWDKRTETTYSSSDWESTANDLHVPTTKAVDDYVDPLIEDLDEKKVNQSDVVTEAQQNAGLWVKGSDLNTDKKVPSTSATSQRLDGFFQDATPPSVTYRVPGLRWFDDNSVIDYVWDQQAGTWINAMKAGPQGLQGPEGTYSTISSPTQPTQRNNGTALQQGDVWFNTTTGELLVYYNDGSSIQWVGVVSGVPGPPGKDGTDGTDGTDGAAATIEVGTTTTGAPGTDAAVSNSGTTSAAV